MSKVKSPVEKKFLSLTRDRRNVYGECPTSSRRNIAKGKRRRHMDERRAVGHVLRGLQGSVEEDEASSAELAVKVTIADSRRRGFRKVPDRPLGVVIARKKQKGCGGRRRRRFRFRHEIFRAISGLRTELR